MAKATKKNRRAVPKLCATCGKYHLCPRKVGQPYWRLTRDETSSRMSDIAYRALGPIRHRSHSGYDCDGNETFTERRITLEEMATSIGRSVLDRAVIVQALDDLALRGYIIFREIEHDAWVVKCEVAPGDDPTARNLAVAYIAPGDDPTARNLAVAYIAPGDDPTARNLAVAYIRFADRVLEWASLASLSRKALAARSGIALSTLREILACRSSPKLEHVHRLAGALGVHPGTLLELRDDRGSGGDERKETA